MSSCARGTCGREAVAGLGYDPVNRAVWLMDLPGDEQQVLALCGAHADNLTVPDGWSSHDERTGAPRLWSLGPVATHPSARSTRPSRLDHERARRQTTVTAASLFDELDDLAEPETTITVDEAPAPVSDPDAIDLGARSTLIPGSCAPDASEDLQVGESTPLLARAFRASRVG